jgi:Protein of unknown function (DUF2613)
MAGFSLAAAASIAVGLSFGAVATVGITLAAADHVDRGLPPAPPPRSAFDQVQYGDRCWHGHCISWNNQQ